MWPYSVRSLLPFWHILRNKSSALLGKLSKTMSYKLRNSPDYSFTMMWSFSITNELSIKIKTTLSSLSNLEYTFLCKQAARIVFFFLPLFPLLYPKEGEKAPPTTASAVIKTVCWWYSFILSNYHHIDKEKF